MKHSPQFIKVVDEARTQIEETDIQTIKKRLDNGEKFHFIDVREQSEWQAGHLPSATHIGKGVIERDIETIIPDFSAEVVLYCGGGYRSALAGESLKKMGYTKVISMDGGFRAWKEAEYPIVKD